MRFTNGPPAKLEATGLGRLRGGILALKAMLADQVLGRLAMLALTLLVVLVLKTSESCSTFRSTRKRTRRARR